MIGVDVVLFAGLAAVELLVVKKGYASAKRKSGMI